MLTIASQGPHSHKVGRVVVEHVALGAQLIPALAHGQRCRLGSVLRPSRSPSSVPAMLLLLVAEQGNLAPTKLLTRLGEVVTFLLDAAAG